MSGLAALLLKKKAIITGSDQSENPNVMELKRRGADIKTGHNPDNLGDDIEAVVISAAIKEDNPELTAARAKGIRVYKYAQMLGQLIAGYDSIAVAGTHGKSTTAGWLIYALKKAGIASNFIIGARITQLGGSSGQGDSNLFIAEACEYDRSFLNLKPKIACLLNIEADHLDYYADEEEIVEAFYRFALGTKDDGIIIANGQDPNVAQVIIKLPPNLRCETFGFDKRCNFSAQNIKLQNGCYSFDIQYNGRILGNAAIALPGRHNILNALAVTALAVHSGLEQEKLPALLGEFTGIDRRLMLKAKIKGITVVDDYAHHPTEIRASLQALRQQYQPKRIWCVFQPHQHSRTRFLLDDLAQSFKFADVTIVPEIYFVRDSEAARREINAKTLVKRLKKNGTNAIFIDNFSEICNYLSKNVKKNDLVITMGAGDIWKVADEYIRRLRDNR